MKAMCDSAFLGVSLSNGAFKRMFASNLYAWLLQNGVSAIEIVVFDRIEVINYEVFRTMQPDVALTRTKARGRDLANMFERVDRDAGLCRKVTLESEHYLLTTAQYKEIHGELVSEYYGCAKFAKAVRWQVVNNLAQRVQRYGYEYVAENMERLSRYILGELTFFQVYAETYSRTLEVYPGPNLRIKEQLLACDFPGLRRFARVRNSWFYRDLGTLVSQRVERRLPVHSRPRVASSTPRAPTTAVALSL